MIQLDRQGDTVTVRLAHGRANVLDTDLCSSIATTIHELNDDPEVGAIVLTGGPGVFCAGVDLKALDGADDQAVTDFLRALDGAFRALLGSSTPIVGAITGHAIAGGAVLAAACDHVVATDDEGALLGFSELEVGVPFPTSAIEIVHARCPAKAHRLVWCAPLLDPTEARSAGLVDELAPADEVLDRALEVAERLAKLPLVTRELTRQQLWADARERVAARSGTWEPQVVAAWRSTQVREAISRFVAERLS